MDENTYKHKAVANNNEAIAPTMDLSWLGKFALALLQAWPPNDTHIVWSYKYGDRAFTIWLSDNTVKVEYNIVVGETNVALYASHSPTPIATWATVGESGGLDAPTRYGIGEHMAKQIVTDWHAQTGHTSYMP